MSQNATNLSLNRSKLDHTDIVLQTVKMVDGCQWTDDLVELQMWSTLSVLAFNAENHSLVLRCGHRAVAFAESDKCLAKRNSKKPDR